MAPTPKKERFSSGTKTKLADNLYNDNKGRKNHYRYRRPNGTYKHFYAATPETANETATQANELRHLEIQANPKKSPARDLLSFYTPAYTQYRERINPDLKTKKKLAKQKIRNRKTWRKITHTAIDNTPKHINMVGRNELPPTKT